MSRLTWFAAGAVAGGYAILRTKSLVRNLTPDGIGARVAALGVGLRVFTSAVSTGMAERESELRDQLARPATGPAIGGPPDVVPSMIEPTSRLAHGHEDGGDGHR